MRKIRNKDKDIIDDIIYTLKNNNERYIIGSWENFLKKRKRKRKRTIIVYLSSGIAASLILGQVFITSFLTTQDSNTKIASDQNYFWENATSKKLNYQDLLKQKNVVKIPLSIRKKTNEIHLSEMKDDKETTKEVENSLFLDDLEDQSEKYNKDGTFIDSNIINHVSEYKSLNNECNNNLTTNKQDSILNFSNWIAKEEELKNSEKFKRLRLGIVTQEFTNLVSSNLASKMSYGLGLVSYIQLSRKISIGTGLILDKYYMNYELEPEFFSGPTSTSVELVCLDIPINFNISFFELKNSNLFITSGVSTLGLIQETYKYQYMLGEDTENTIYFDNINIAGQINFSIGWEYKLSQNFNIGLESYTKIPIYKLAEENLQFYVFGISFKVSK